MSRRAAFPLALLAAAAGLACRSPAGMVELRWTGGDTGSARLAATARQCGDGPVALLAVSGDTGVAIGLYGAKPLGVGDYGVSDRAASSPPPAASFGARWLDSAVVAGYRGRGGTVTLAAAGGELAGRFTVEAQRMDGAREVRLTGSFRGVPVETCGADAASQGD